MTDPAEAMRRLGEAAEQTRREIDRLVSLLDTPGEPLPEGPEEPTTDPIIEDDPSVQHEPVVED